MASEEVITSVDVSLSGFSLPSFPKGEMPLDLDFLTSTLPLRGAPMLPEPLAPKQIRFEELSRISFPALLPPLSLPDPPKVEQKRKETAPEVRALLAPAPWKPVECVPPVAAAPRKRRRWPKIFFAAILGTVTGWALIQTPLAQHPRVRPYAEVVNAKTNQGWVAAKAGTARTIAWSVATWNTYVR